MLNSIHILRYVLSYCNAKDSVAFTSACSNLYNICESIVAAKRVESLVLVQDKFVRCFVLPNGKIEGTHVQTDGNSKYITNYTNGIKSGPFAIYHKDTISVSGIYIDGLLCGEHKSYYSNGHAASIQHYERGKLHGKTESYYENGSIHSTHEYKHGIQMGIHKVYYDTGTIQMECEYTKGKRSAERHYYESGKISKSYLYRDGKLNGVYETFYPDGSPRKTCKYVKGLLDGAFVKYFSTGLTRYKGSYKSGRKVGIHAEFDEHGSVISKRAYVDGKIFSTSRLK